MSFTYFELYVEEECRRLEAPRRERLLRLHELLQQEQRVAHRRQLAWLLGLRLQQMGGLLCRWAMHGQSGQRPDVYGDVR